MLSVEGTFQDGVVQLSQPIAGWNGQKVMIVFLQEGNDSPIDAHAAEIFDDLLPVPAMEEILSPILTVIPLQLLAYHIAARRGLDVVCPATSPNLSPWNRTAHAKPQ